MFESRLRQEVASIEASHADKVEQLEAAHQSQEQQLTTHRKQAADHAELLGSLQSAHREHLAQHNSQEARDRFPSHEETWHGDSQRQSPLSSENLAHTEVATEFTLEPARIPSAPVSSNAERSPEAEVVTEVTLDSARAPHSPIAWNTEHEVDVGEAEVRQRHRDESEHIDGGTVVVKGRGGGSRVVEGRGNVNVVHYRPGAGSAAHYRPDARGRPIAATREGAEQQNGENSQTAIIPRRAHERRLPGFYSVGTSAAGVGCFSFAGAVTEARMDLANCRGATGMLCNGCFIATPDNNDKELEIIACSTARYKVGTQMSAPSGVGTHVFMIEVINTDTDNTLTIKGCVNPTCSPAKSTYVLEASNAAVGYCYAGGSDAIYWQTSGIRNAASISFVGSTIADLGTVTTADINGGEVDGADITVGSGKTLDVSAGTLTLGAGQIPAAKLSGGAFGGSAAYTFSGKTITDLGTVTTADIDGGTINDADITVGSGKTLDVAAGTLTLGAGQIPATKLTGGAFGGSDPYDFVGLTITDLGTVTTAAINGGTIDGVTISTSGLTLSNAGTVTASAGTPLTATLDKQVGVITSPTNNLAATTGSEIIRLTNSVITATTDIVLVSSGGCTNGQLIVVSVTPTSGSVDIVTANVGATICGSTYKLYFAVLT